MMFLVYVFMNNVFSEKKFVKRKLLDMFEYYLLSNEELVFLSILDNVNNYSRTEACWKNKEINGKIIPEFNELILDNLIDEYWDVKNYDVKVFGFFSENVKKLDSIINKEFVSNEIISLNHRINSIEKINNLNEKIREDNKLNNYIRFVESLDGVVSPNSVSYLNDLSEKNGDYRFLIDLIISEPIYVNIAVETNRNFRLFEKNTLKRIYDELIHINDLVLNVKKEQI